MKYLKRAALWYGMLNKRFLKKYIFTILLLMIPLLVLAVREISGEESGVLKVLLYQEGEDPEGSTRVVKQLLEKHGVVCYEKAEDLEEAYRTVRRGKADCVWIFPQNLRESISQYLDGERENILTVFVREDTVQTKIVREQLFGVIYPMISYETTRQFIGRQPTFRNISEDVLDEKFEALYEKNRIDGSIFLFAYLDGTEYGSEGEKSNYLTAPLRGLLALLVFLCGFAVTMFYFRDEQEGIFCWMHIRKRKCFPLLYILTGTADAGAAAYLALYLSGTFTDWRRELPLMALYVLAAAGFCNLLRTVNRNLWSYGACIPIILLVSLVLCPVFLHIRRFAAIQYLLPAYYYLNSLYSDIMPMRMLLYTAVLGAAGIFLEKSK